MDMEIMKFLHEKHCLMAQMGKTSGIERTPTPPKVAKKAKKQA